MSGTPPNIKYTPNSGFVGDDEILFRVRGGGKESDSGVIKLKILNDNTPPSPRAVEEGSTSIMISGNQFRCKFLQVTEDQENRGFYKIYKQNIIGSSYLDTNLKPNTKYCYKISY